MSQVTDTVSEAMRSRRDPVLVASRRRKSAQRRLVVLVTIGVILTAVGASWVVKIANGEVTATSIASAVLIVALWIYAVVAALQSASELRSRTRIVRSLPPPQPDRRPADRSIRPLMVRLGEYSDALRQCISAVGIEAPAASHHTIRELRDETIAAADAAEVRLRQQASELTAMLRALRTSPDTRMNAVCAQLQHDMSIGVDSYGRLVSAVSDASAASRELAATVDGHIDDGLAETTQRLSALADGMRELTDPPSAG